MLLLNPSQISQPKCAGCFPRGPCLLQIPNSSHISVTPEPLTHRSSSDYCLLTPLPKTAPPTVFPVLVNDNSMLVVTQSLLTPLSLTGTAVLSANFISSTQKTSRSTSLLAISYHPCPATVVSPLDYCNSFLPGLSDSTLNPLSSLSIQQPE